VSASLETIRSFVQAQCPGPVACDTLGITFGKGSARIQVVRGPNTVGNTVVGTVKMNRVFPAQPLLKAVIVGDVTYGPDPNGNCALANTQALGVTYATADMPCTTRQFASNCKGSLVLPALIPPECTDVGVFVRNAHILVYDINAPGSLSSLIGRDGLKISNK
jgi:hypothetical protein